MKSKKTKSQKKTEDPLKLIKFKGYCWAFTAPGEDFTMDDLLNFAKFYLCKKSHRLWKDPIWDTYTDEEVLIEYFAHVFSSDEEERRKFEASINAGTAIYGEDIYDWLDRKVKENQEEMKTKAESLPEKISFSPETGKDQEE